MYERITLIDPSFVFTTSWLARLHASECLRLTTPSLTLIIDGPQNGATNMQRDKAIFEYANDPVFVKHSPIKAIVRLYQWEEPTISLGRNQPAAESLLRPDRLKEYPIGQVRRFTGGRAVLHEHEWTYSVTAALTHPILGGGIRDSYKAISNILSSFLRSLAPSVPIAAHFASPTRPRHDPSAVCYDSPGWAELLVSKRKLIGSAQKRGRYAFLEHGSIPLERPSLPLETWLHDRYHPQQTPDYIVLKDFLEPAAFTQIMPSLAEAFYRHLVLK